MSQVTVIVQWGDGIYCLLMLTHSCIVLLLLLGSSICMHPAHGVVLMFVMIYVARINLMFSLVGCYDICSQAVIGSTTAA